MSKQAYNIEGDFQMGRMRQHFKVQVAATSEDEARTHVLADLGSRHGVSRRQIRIDSVDTVKGDDVNPVVRKRIGN